ncbi:dienelactone hydrolase family protein [Synechococcus sp. UW105]|uniref:alpha/beta hydrolase n=1 Tax=Synechococcus sp. UW105 TaxID=337067 RepID=UPI000E0FC269
MPLATTTALRQQPRADAQARLVLLHGWGADADDLLILGEALVRQTRTALDVVALPAPELHPQGMGRQWYGLFPAEWEAVPAAQEHLKARLLELANDGLPLQATVVLGFSQGAAMALATGTTLPLAGLIACSGYPHPNWNPPIQRPPVLLIHGLQDEVVPASAVDELSRRLAKSQAELNLETFHGGHTIPESVFPTICKTIDTWLETPGVDA